jgi:hypothetical protein
MVSKEILKRILSEQNEKLEQLKDLEFIIRKKLDEINKFTKTKSIIIITGIRRCGKSVFLSQIINNSFKEYYYINFEDERLSDFNIKDFDKLYETCIELFGQNKVFFLDEIQNIEGWERWVRRMHDNKFKFFITGSNASLLSKELGTKLTGRHLQFLLFPFSFREFLEFKKFYFKRKDFYLTEKRALIIKHFSEYLDQGGFPEYLSYNQIELLQEYFNDIIQRDIVERYKIGNVKQLKELARYILTNSGNLTTYNNLKKLTEIKSVNTIIKYFSYLENSYLLFKVPYFSYSLKKQAANPFKIFAIDLGLRNAISFQFSKDTGRNYETIVAIELKRRKKEIYYWKNTQHEEVDFVIKEGLKVKQLIQVCFNTNQDKTKEREIRALMKASKELKCNNLLVITEDKDKEEIVKNKKIIYIPLWKWLLE